MLRKFAIVFSTAFFSQAQAQAQDYNFNLAAEPPLLAESWSSAIASDDGIASWQSLSATEPNMNWVDGQFFVGSENAFVGAYDEWLTEPGSEATDFSAANLLYWSTRGQTQLYADQTIDAEAMGLRAIVGPENQYVLSQDFALREFFPSGLVDCPTNPASGLGQPCTSSFQTNDWAQEACQRLGAANADMLFHPCNPFMLERGTSFIEIDCPYCYGTGTVTVRPPQIVISPNGTDTIAFGFGGGLPATARTEQERNLNETSYSVQLLHQIIVTSIIERLLEVSGESDTAKFIGVPATTYLWGREATTFNVVIPSSTVRDVQSRWDGFELTITGDLFQNTISTGTSTTLARFSILVTSFKSARRQPFTSVPPPIWDFYEVPSQEEQNAIEVRIANRLGSI